MDARAGMAAVGERISYGPEGPSFVTLYKKRRY